jgi:hypothetical protein
MYSSRLNVVSARMRVADPSLTSRRVASMPSSTGIRMSISATSGRVRRISATAAAPSAASPTTSMPGSSSSSDRKPARTIAWSSAIAIRIVMRARSAVSPPP